MGKSMHVSFFALIRPVTEGRGGGGGMHILDIRYVNFSKIAGVENHYFQFIHKILLK